MNLTLPRLRDDAVIRRFDEGGGRAQYVVAIDGRHFVATESVAMLLEMTRHSPTHESLAQRMSERLGRVFTALEMDAVIRHRIPPVFFRADGDTTVRGPLHLRARLVDAVTLGPVLKLTSGLFAPGAVIALGCLFLFFDAIVGIELWRHGVESASHASFVGALVLVIAGVAMHELGHLSACHRFGAAHGGIGAALYWGLPVLYAEVHGAWLLSRMQRSVVDVGGVYFQCIFLLAIAAIWLVYPSGTLLIALWASHFLVLNTLNPVLKYDGYWLLSDLSGTYNLHQRVRDSARHCWRALWRRSNAGWPSRRDRLLLALFMALATAYFGYLLHFMAHNLGYATSRLAIAASTWQRLSTALGLTLTIVFALAVTLMLARAIGEVVATETTSDTGRHDDAR